ncbi:hypothetical protein M0R45_025205 [Rubus argutus]|uniref:Leucine-rich repeat-containing N-terminal plant-type domain-containing protein n=1 Tax=Rubus argutus TaxID=59490 RepID=A0AAW1WU23_RUBAR
MERSMRTVLLVMLLTVAAIAISIGSCNGNLGSLCHESEKQALVIFKQDLKDPSNKLSSWVAKEDSNCCNWAGVVCDNVTGHIRELHLGNSHSDFDSSLGGKINPSLLNLKHLTYLNLSNSNFLGTQIPTFFGSLNSLRHLDLSHAQFVGMIPQQLGNLSGLLHLRLGSNDALMVENLQWISGLSQLEHLDLSYVDLRNASDHWLQATNMLPSLIELNMSSCRLEHVHPPPAVMNFTSLAILDLSGNGFDSLMPRWFFSLRNLVSLTLSNCGFQGPIPTSPHNITSLKEIDFSDNFLNLSIPEWLFNQKDLTHLNLDSNRLQGPLPGGNLTSIVELDLLGNRLGGKVPQSLGNLCNLVDLNLGANNFIGNGSEFLESLSACNLCQIQSLQLVQNNLSGHLTAQIGNLKNLRLLDLSYNQFDGALPENIGQLKSLTRLLISYNSFQGVVSELHFTHLTRLEAFEAKENSLTLETSRDWFPPFQLKSLFLDSWRLGPDFPMWLQRQRQLYFLSLSNTGISGTIPKWFWNSSSQLSYLNLSNNYLYGEIESIAFKGLDVVDLSSNQFHGSLPLVSSTLDVLDLSNSSFSGTVFHFFCDSPHQLTDLFIGNNFLSGEIPDCWMNWQMLEILDLENNMLTGNMPSSIGNLVNLQSLHLRNNFLSGELPLSMQNCSELLVVDLRGNRFSGSLPLWIGKCLLKLKLLNLRSNKLQGVIPDELCSLTDLQILDLAHNNLSGTIPRCFSNISAMIDLSNLYGILIPSEFRYAGMLGRYIGSMFLVTKGRELEYGYILGLVTTIDLSNNSISGEIPEELTNLIGLRNLNLSANLLTRRIPSKIGNMEWLESLDLSMNQLSGEIPASLTRMTFLSYLNISYNNLTGRIPESTQLQSFDQSSFVGNELCGPPLSKNCSASKVIPPTVVLHRRYDLLDDEWFYFYLSLGLGFMFGFWSILGSLLLNMPWSSAFSQFLNTLVLKLHGLIAEYF